MLGVRVCVALSCGRCRLAMAHPWSGNDGYHSHAGSRRERDWPSNTEAKRVHPGALPAACGNGGGFLASLGRSE